MPSRGLSRKGMASFLFFYLTRPLLLGEAPHPLLNTLASPKSFTLGNVQMHLSLHSLNQDFSP